MTVKEKIRKASARSEESLCETCRCAHIRQGFRESEQVIFCNLGEQLRPVLFKVAECTDYANRSVPYRYELEQMALLINVPRARKKTGFESGVGFVAEEAQTEDEE
jgi:hypothetical protein